jgi:ketosteroid isomerase-like protein
MMMKITGLIGASALALTLAACSSPAPKADTGKIADAVKADAAQAVADFNAHDADKSAAHNAKDAVAMMHGMPNVVGADAILAGYKKGPTDPTSKVVVSDESVDVAAAGDMAVYRATYTFTGTDPAKKPFTETGNWVLGYKPQADGSWKVAWSVISDTKPAPAATPAPAAPAPAKN